ncbi:MAG: SWIM zinc finger family protein [Chloroflexi bacterium]|nr:SWIM zinc finger family protein [Chloroflexota bacterium]
MVSSPDRADYPEETAGRALPPDQPAAAQTGQPERPFRELGRRAAGRGRHVYVAGALALTEPGPAAAGIVVADEHDRVLAQRAYYLGPMTRSEATAQALLSAARLALAGEGEPILCECADFTYRGIPCKHILAVARETGALQRVFYPPPSATPAPGRLS